MLFPRPQRWSDLTQIQQLAIILLTVVQLALLLAALFDLRRRPAEQVNGSKQAWTLLAFVNYIGPLAYFIFGRK